MKVDIGTYKFTYEKRLTATEKSIGTAWATVMIAFVVGGGACALVAAMGIVGALMVFNK